MTDYVMEYAMFDVYITPSLAEKWMNNQNN